MKSVFLGYVLSEIKCNKERQLRASLSNKQVGDVPIRYGSIRVRIDHLLDDDGKLFSIDTELEGFDDIVRSQLILEVSYKINPDLSKIDRHSHVDFLQPKSRVAFSISRCRTSRNHFRKLVGFSDQITELLFLKTWADRISPVNYPLLPADRDWIDTKDVFTAYKDYENFSTSSVPSLSSASTF